MLPGEIQDLGDLELDAPGQPEKLEISTIEMTQEHKYWLDVINTVRNTNQYNFKQARIRIDFTWNVKLLKGLLSDYHDKEIIDLL